MVKWILIIKWCMINKPPPKARLGRARERSWERVVLCLTRFTLVAFWGWCSLVFVPLPETLNQATSLTCPTFSSSRNHSLGIFSAGELECRWKAKPSSSCHSCSASPVSLSNSLLQILKYFSKLYSSYSCIVLWQLLFFTLEHYWIIS